MTQNGLQLSPEDNHRLAALCGQYNEHLKYIAKQLDIQIKQHGFHLEFVGDEKLVKIAREVIQTLYAETSANQDLTLKDIHLCLQGARSMTVVDSSEIQNTEAMVRIKGMQIKSRGENQARYLRNIASHDINFGIGPSGTGKTFLAVACAVDALNKEWVKRIVLVRPAVEAGENLGFLPGDLAQKVDPYLRPLYDALYEMLGFAQVDKYIEHNIIEVAPLAFMRGRTLNHSFIILDESQNTTADQMKMFLTRIGFGSKAVVTGDVTQVDLDAKKSSGLKHAISVLQGIDAISFTHFEARDVVRHSLVQRIIEAYERHQ